MTGPFINPRSTQFKTYYLGTAGAMNVLRTPNAAYEHPASRAEVRHDLISGGAAVTRFGQTRRQWSLAWGTLTPDTANFLVSLYAGAFGDGPFRFVDPAWRNALTFDASTFGARLDSNTAWGASNGSASLSFDTSVVAPADAAGYVTSGVLRWSNTPLNAQLAPAAWNGSVFVPDTVTTPPYLPQTVTSITLYARSVTGTPSVSLRSTVIGPTGTVLDTQTQTKSVSNSAWTAFTVLAPASVSGGTYIIPNVLSGTANAILQLACPLVQYTENPPDGWVAGLGVPSVIIPEGLGSQSELLYARDHTLTLAEI